MNPETAIRRLTCLVLFLALGCGLVAGPHPCQAQLTPAPEAAPAPAHAAEGAATACSAHAAASGAGPELQSSSPDGERDCCAEHGADCAYACQLLAGVVHAGAPRAAEQAAFRAVAPALALDLPLFAHAIDHIPLA